MPDKKAKKPAAKKTAKRISPKPVKAQTTKSEPVTDRVIRVSGSQKNTACPECKAFPTIAKIRRGAYELRRCRECGHRFEIKGGR